MKTLYIFATSERPDAYINAFAYAVDHLQVETMMVIVISEHDYPEDQESNLLATTVYNRITSQLTELSQGHYLEFDAKSQQTNRVVLSKPENIAIYKQCLDAMNRSGFSGRVIKISQLDSHLLSFVTNGDCLFDVSALKKNLLVDVVSTFLSLSFNHVYSFELKKKQTFGQDDLYHALVHQQDYIFRNLTNSESVSKSLKRLKGWSTNVKFIGSITFVLLVLFTIISVYMNNTVAATIMNIIGVVTGAASYLYLFRKQ